MEIGMSDEGRDYRGGDIELLRDKPRGLPFLKPLHDPPPYQYTDWDRNHWEPIPWDRGRLAR